MSENKLVIPLKVNDQDIELKLFGENSLSIVEEQKDAAENGEAIYQIREGCFYEYEITDGFCLETSEIVIFCSLDDIEISPALSDIDFMLFCIFCVTPSK